MVALVVLVSLISLTPVLALIITPPSPTPGQPFTLSGPIGGGNVEVFVGSSCTGTLVYSIGITSTTSYTLTVPGQPAGQYSASVQGDSPSCVNFEVGSAVGGQMLPINMVAVLTPWIIVIVAVTVGLVAAGVFARRRITKHN
jgi:hypothetical protein